MGQRGFFFDSVEDDRVYTSEDFSLVLRQMASNGYTLGDREELKVIPLDPVGLGVVVREGSAWVQGRMLEVYEEHELSISPNTSGSPRIDRVVIRKDTSEPERRIYVVVKEGTSGANPEPPALTRSGEVYELSLAQINVANGTTEITAGDITDERNNREVCGRSRQPSQAYSDGFWTLIEEYEDSSSTNTFDVTFSPPLFDEYRLVGFVENPTGSNADLRLRVNGVATTNYFSVEVSSGGIASTSNVNAVRISQIRAGELATFDIGLTGRHPYQAIRPRVWSLGIANARISDLALLDGYLAQAHSEVNQINLFSTQNGRGMVQLFGRNYLF